MRRARVVASVGGKERMCLGRGKRFSDTSPRRTRDARRAEVAHRAHLNFRGSVRTPIIVRTTLVNIAPG